MKSFSYLPLSMGFLLLSIFLSFHSLTAATFSTTQTDYGVTLTYNSPSSDYSVGDCNCDNETYVCLRPNNSSNADCNGWSSGVGGSGTLFFAAGPSRTIPYYVKGRVRGTVRVVFCTGTYCEGSRTWGPFTRTTEPIRQPADLEATTELDINRIVLSWNKTTAIPNDKHVYRIYRDSLSNLIATVAGTAISGGGYTWEDNTIGPSEAHTYYVTTYSDEWGGHESEYVSAVGTTVPMSISATDGNFFNYTRIEWTPVAQYVDGFSIQRDGADIWTTTNATAAAFEDVTGICGRPYEYQLVINKDGTDYVWEILRDTGFIRPNGRFFGRVISPSGVPVENIQVCAELLEDLPAASSGTVYCDTTGANGRYDIQEIYYDQTALFEIVPNSLDFSHSFDPLFQTWSLTKTDNAVELPDFIDTTVLSISGFVEQIYENNNCGVAGVEIRIRDVNIPSFEFIDSTDENGFFAVNVQGPGTYIMEPSLGNHSFSPGGQTLTISSNTAGIQFIDLATNTVSGYAKGACDIYLGQSEIRIFSLGEPNTPCIEKTVMTEPGTGYFEAELPAGKYELDILDFTPEPGVLITPETFESYFDTDTVDITFEDQVSNFIFREVPEISISFENLDYECEAYAYPILEQGIPYEMTILVEEVFGEERCPVEGEMELIITNEVSDSIDFPDTITVINGIATKTIIPGYPNFFDDNLKLFSVEAVVGEESVVKNQEILVLGNQAREQTFTTVSPEIPFLILRDPPGDESYSFFEASSSSETAFRTFFKGEDSDQFWLESKLGFKKELDFGPVHVEDEVWGSVGTSLEITAQNSTQSEFILSFTNTERYETSSDPAFIGRDGDLYVGAALNFIYALTDVLSFNEETCMPEASVSMIMGAEDFATTFMYTDKHIRGTLIPQLEQLRQIVQESNPDSVAFYDNQIEVWQQTLQLNEALKEDALFTINRSWDAGSGFTETQTATTEGTFSIETGLLIEEEIAIAAGYEVSGTGSQGGWTTRARFELGSSFTDRVLQSRTVGFSLGDNDPGDFHSANILNDPAYATPVFDLLSGRTSCPHEPGTQPREGVQLTTNTFVQIDVSPDDPAKFDLTLSNSSQSDEGRTYYLEFLQSSNPDGASITIGGSPYVSPIPYSIGAGASESVQVCVDRNGSSFTYEDLQFVLRSGCEDEQIGDTLSLSVYFESACSPVTIAVPGENWLINKDFNTDFLIEITDYTLAELDQLSLQYAPEGSSSWSTALILTSDDLDSDGSTTVAWPDVLDLEDDVYQLRLKVDCGQGYLYSSTVDGRIDREAPRIFGLPQPSDAIWLPGDLIAIEFNEAINCNAFDSENVLLTTNFGTFFTTQVGCNDRQIIIQANEDLSQFENAFITVELGFVEDLYGNQVDSAITWAFQIGDGEGMENLDFDNDDIPNEEDNCDLIYNPNQEDLDDDGLGDVCDEDDDGDGIADVDDNCPYLYNPDQAPICSLDADGDGIEDLEDNCPNASNLNQLDSDSDGIGDVCDDDLDGDGVLNTLDNCPNVSNPEQGDADGDGIGDLCATSVSDLSQPGRPVVQLTPNPARAFLRVSWASAANARAKELQIFDIQGKVLLGQQITTGAKTLELSLRDFNPGVYFVQLRFDTFVETRKLVIQ